MNKLLLILAVVLLAAGCDNKSDKKWMAGYCWGYNQAVFEINHGGTAEHNKYCLDSKNCLKAEKEAR